MFSVKRIWLLVALFALLTTVGSVAGSHLVQREEPAATADLIVQNDDEICPPGERECEVEDGTEGEGGGDGDGTGDPDGGGGGACTWTRNDVIVASLAAQTTIEIPCHLPPYGWYGGDSCYYGESPSLVDPPAPPEGKTEEDGRYYWANCFYDIYQFNGIWVIERRADIQWRWFDFEDVPTVTPLQVAQAWLAGITLDPVQIRLAPPAGTSGLVGLPVWLGLEHTDSSLGPLVDDDGHCLGGVCVEIGAVVTTVDWSLGDGNSVSCEPGEHTVWERGKHDFLSPAGCHHYYQHASRDQAGGQYQITATSNWQVNWSDTSGPGAPLTTSRTANATLQIDEIQVLTGR